MALSPLSGTIIKMRVQLAALILIVAGVLGALYVYIHTPSDTAAIADLAQCLASKKATMYGAEWCSHCQNQKRIFGSAFGYIPYVECPDNATLCIEKGIVGYPTWIFESGARLEGERSFAELAEKAGCSLPDQLR